MSLKTVRKKFNVQTSTSVRVMTLCKLAMCSSLRMSLYSRTTACIYYMCLPYRWPFSKAHLKFTNWFPTLQAAAGFITRRCSMKISLQSPETCLTCVKRMFSLHNVFVKTTLLLNGIVAASRKCLMNVSTFLMQKACIMLLLISIFSSWLSKCDRNNVWMHFLC